MLNKNIVYQPSVFKYANMHLSTPNKCFCLYKNNIFKHIEKYNIAFQVLLKPLILQNKASYYSLRTVLDVSFAKVCLCLVLSFCYGLTSGKISNHVGWYACFYRTHICAKQRAVFINRDKS